METVRKTITFTKKQDDWIKLQIERGDFTNDSEYIRDLIRKDQIQRQKQLELERAIQEGLDSGISDKSVFDIMNDVENRLKANGKL